MLYDFEDYCLDADRQELRRGADVVAIEPQVFDLLLYLIRSRERVVSKDDLVAHVWNGRFVSDSTLTSRITTARKAIGDSGEDQRLIRTISRKGLRFVGQVRERQNVGGTDFARSMSDRDSALGLLLGAAPRLPDKPSLAVLPFDSISADAEQEYFADGITEDLTTALSRNHQLFVIARHSSFTYKGHKIDVRQVTRDLGVQYVVEGSLRPFGDKYRINAQLIDGLGARHIWADTYELPRAGFYEGQDAIIRGIAASVQTHITLHEGESLLDRPRETQGASELLKQAWGRVYQLTPGALRDAAALAEAALQYSPASDRAYQVLAVCHHHIAYLGYAEDWPATVDVAYRNACRAVELFEPDEYSHWILASTLVLKREHERAIAEYTRAIEINPNCSMAYGSMGTALAWAGKWEESLRSNEIAIRSNPRDPSIFLRFFVNGLAHFTAGHFDEARQWFAKTVQRKKTFRNAHLLLIASLALLDEKDAANRALAEMREYFGAVRPDQLRELPFIRTKDAEALERGLRLAGVTEGWR